MINTFESINWKPEESDLKSFARTLFIGSIIIAILFFLYNYSSSPTYKALPIATYIFSFGCIIAVLSNIAPKVISPVYFIWYVIGAAVGAIISNCLLLLFFYLFFSPFSMVLRFVSKRDPLQLKRKTSSNWQDCKEMKDKRQYFKQY